MIYPNPCLYSLLRICIYFLTQHRFSSRIICFESNNCENGLYSVDGDKPNNSKCSDLWVQPAEMEQGSPGIRHCCRSISTDFHMSTLKHFCFLFLTWKQDTCMVGFLALRIRSRRRRSLKGHYLGKIFILRSLLQGWGRWYNHQNIKILTSSLILPITRHLGGSFWWTEIKQERKGHANHACYLTDPFKVTLRDEVKTNENVSKIWRVNWWFIDDIREEIQGDHSDSVTLVIVTDTVY